MNGFDELYKLFLYPLFMSVTDMLLLFYLCGGNREFIRKQKNWLGWFILYLLLLVGTQAIFNGKTNPQANFFLFYTVHFLVLLAFSSKCFDEPPSVRFYLVILSVLADDICLITYISLSATIFGIDYLDAGPYAIRITSAILLLLLKIGVTAYIKNQTRQQIYGIESVYQVAITTLSALPYFFLRSYAFFFHMNPLSVPLIIHFLDILCGVCALINMIISERLSFQSRQNEQLRMKSLIEKQHDHYLWSLNSYETVSRKYHDLRHILRGIDSMQDLAEVKEYVHAVEGEIRNFELIYDTGNKTLDVILSDWMRKSRDKGIQMHVHADGQGWNSVRDIDIATIFGNALDNAFESTEAIRDAELRIVEVRTGRVNDMLISRFENRFTHPLEMKQSRLLSTKADKQNHGYGLQSMEMTVRKYNGEIDINTDNGAFILTVIIPVAHCPVA